MAQFLSACLRIRVIGAVEAGMSRNAAARRFGDPREIEATRVELETKGATVVHDGADVTKADEITRLVATAENGITSNAICPGYVLTPLVEKQIPDTARARGMTEDQVKRDVRLAAQWTRKFVTIEQLAGVALFPCSDSAENITGVALPADGGWTAA